jgi:branched-chain amino acid transport system substrate-binding protein
MVNNDRIEPKTVTMTITGTSADLLSIGLEIRFTNNNKLVNRIVAGKLPPLPQQLLDTYQEWKRGYLTWGENYRYWQRTLSLPKNPIPTNVSIQDCDTLEEQLIQKFNQWLNVDESPGLAQIARNLLTNAIPNEYKNRPELLSFVIQTKTNNPQLDLDLQRLPWNEWKFIRKYYDTGIALSTHTAPIIEQKQQKLKALVICGKYSEVDNKLDLQPDLDAIQTYLGDIVELEFWISDPATTSKLELLKKLDTATYHLLFFCGHSSSKNQIQLNDREYISADETRFQDILTKLKDRGLILAFFNSCDGLVIAHSLMSMGIPYIVVMKELVHDLVAQEFIKNFLKKVIEPKTPIHTAIDRARQELQWLEGLPHGEFLPVLFQNPEQPPLYLNPELESIDILDTIEKKPVLPKNKGLLWLSLFGLGILIVTSLGILDRYINTINNLDRGLQGRTSMGEQQLKGSDQSAEIDPAYQDFKLHKYQASLARFDAYLNEKNLYNNPEIVIYRNNAKAYISHQDRGTKLIKLATSVPFGNNRSVARELLRGIAQRQSEYNSDLSNIHIIIEIGNDDNNPALTEKIATKFVEDPDVLAVIGHNASEATEAGANIYNPGKLVMLSPTSFKTTLRFTGASSSIYRMVPQMTSFASKLAKYTTNNLKHDTLKVGMCVHKNSPDNSLFHEQFNYILQGIGSKPIDLNCNSFSTIGDPSRSQQIINTIIKEKINVLMLAPHIDTLPQSLKFMKQVRQHPQLKDMKMIGSTSLYSGVISSQNQDNLLNGLILAVPYFPNPQNQFVTNFQKEWNQPLDTWRTVMSYAATSVITSNLDQTSTRMSILNRMADNKIPYNSNHALPPFSFNSSGERKISDNPGELIQLDGINFRSASNLDK